MSLKVWLPLTGSLENKGTSMVSVEGADITVDADGKIGSCYSFNGTSSYLQLKNIWPSGWPEFSVACWCYPIGGFGSLLLLRGDGSSHRFRIYATTYGFRDTNHLDFVSVGTSTEIPSNVWSHICAIYNRGELSFYVNGVLVNHTTEYYNETSTLISDTKQEFYIGMNKTSSSESYYSGKINDFRVYDHALSTAEVKEISQGLICHYKLDDAKPRPNLLVDTNESSLNAKYSEHPRYWESAGNGTYTCVFEKIKDPPVPGIKYGVRQTVTQTSGTHQMTFYSGGGVEVVVGNTYTMSCYVKCAEGNNASSVRFQYGVGNYRAQNVGLIKDNRWHQYSWTFIAEEETVSDGVTRIYCGGLPSTGEILICGYKLEEGDSATPWIPNEVEPLYKILCRDKICDSSGYGHHGISANTPHAVNTTKRYSRALKFNDMNTYINCGQGGYVKDAVTISLWAYSDDWTTDNGKLISCTQSGGWAFEKNSGYNTVNFIVGTGVSSNTYRRVWSTTTMEELNNGDKWHMFTGTCDGFTAKIYIDGVLEGENAFSEEQIPLFYNSNVDIFLGSEATNNHQPANPRFGGIISDVRIYATALSAEDIRKLYETSVSIDNRGNIHAFSFDERDGIAIRKNGTIEANNISEFCPSLKYDRKVYVEPDGSKWVHIVHHNNPSESGMFAETDPFQNGVYLDENRWYDAEQIFSQLTAFEFLYKQKITSSSEENKFRWIQSVSPSTAAYTDVTKDKVTRISTSGYTDGGYGGIYLLNHNTRLSIANDKSTQWYGACGAWYMQNSTSRVPGYPGSSSDYITTGYVDLYVRIDNQDLNVGAGFYRNGTINGNNLIET